MQTSQCECFNRFSQNLSNLYIPFICKSFTVYRFIEFATNEQTNETIPMTEYKMKVKSIKTRVGQFVSPESAMHIYNSTKKLTKIIFVQTEREKWKTAVKNMQNENSKEKTEKKKRMKKMKRKEKVIKKGEKDNRMERKVNEKKQMTRK